ncbi:DUF2971 domain-containing protein [Brachybacterium kimchii]|uniref:DUF2971 domain-containing protein n=1 Tax=Brachybacterium kimchii TaxID=2942909 RepID=A0ABY4N6U3_9MICO|nr:DUF2971 domain-containing protein [Brachybacterium kimchii]UQN30272.1 DUF2971 domain-containing protein [Brachybacterium kimchii]
MVFREHPGLFDVQDPRVSVWRYMDLSKYLDLLQTSELHMTRVDTMVDQWEGVYGQANAAVRPFIYGAEIANVVSHSLRAAKRHARTHFYLNCWNIGRNESDALWHQYASGPVGVALKSTIGRLKESLPSRGGPAMFGSTVKYVDYDETFIPEDNILGSLIHKREHFQHENEYRLIANWEPEVFKVENGIAVESASDDPPKVLRVPVDLAVLIEQVYVSPEAHDWQRAVVERVSSKYRADLRVVRSRMASGPPA